MIFQLSFALSLLSVTLTKASWLLSKDSGFTRTALLSNDADIAASAPLQSQSRSDYFAVARDRLAIMEQSSTCKRSATIKLFATCESLRSSPNADVDLETVQNLYSAHLAICELDGAHANLPRHCRLGLPSDASEIASFLREDGTRQLQRCLTDLQSRSQWWTSYSNNRRDAYILCKAMRPFDQDDFVRSLKNVVSTNEAVAQALDNFIKDVDRKTDDHRNFAATVDVFRRQLIHDLEESSTEVSNRFTDLISQADSAVKAILNRLAKSVREATAEVDGLTQVIESSSNDAQHLNEIIVNGQKVVMNGVADISLAQKQQLDETSELAIQLQNHLEWMIDTRIYEVVGNASDRLQLMMDQMDGLQKSVQSTSEHFHILDVKIAALVATLPYLSNIITRFWKWSFILLTFIIFSRRVGTCLFIMLVTWEATSTWTNIPPDIDSASPETPTTILPLWPLRIITLSLVVGLLICYQFKGTDPPKWKTLLRSLGISAKCPEEEEKDYCLPYRVPKPPQHRVRIKRTFIPPARSKDGRFARAASEPLESRDYD